MNYEIQKRRHRNNECKNRLAVALWGIDEKNNERFTCIYEA